MLASLMVMAALVGQTPYPTPSDAVGWAIAHQSTVPEADRPLYRYLWIPPYMVPPETEQYHWSEIDVGAVLSYVLNESASQSGVVVPVQGIANGWMLAVYLPNYASAIDPCPSNPKKSELQALVDVWDGLALNDPYFHVTQENNFTEVIKVDGKNQKQTRIEKVAVLAPHIKEEYAAILHTWNRSPALVYRADWFLEQLIDTHYYDFMQFGKTQFDVYETLGVSEKLAREKEGDQRAGVATSSVTGKPRRVDRIQGVVGRNGTGAVWETWDILNKSVAVGKHFAYNLIEFSPDGGEVIFERANGMHGYLVIDAQRNLLRAADPNLVGDKLVADAPDGPGTKVLVPGISCIRCHGAADGLQPVPNDIKRMLASGHTDILGDLGNGKSQQENVVILAGLYGGDFDRRLEIGRYDYEAAIRTATFMPDRPGGMGTVEASALVSTLYARYVYDRMTPYQASRELGFTVEEGVDGREAFNEILKPLQPVAGYNYSRENVIIAFLRDGIKVRRRDWEQVFAPAMAQMLNGVPMK